MMDDEKIISLFFSTFSIGMSSHREVSEGQRLLVLIANIFPQIMVTAFAAPAPAAQFITMFIINKFSKVQ